MTQISVGNAWVEFGATTLFKDITFTVAAGERWGVVGRNGTGKTTLFKLITGDLAQQTLTFRPLTPFAPRSSPIASPSRAREQTRAATSTGSLNNRRSDHGKKQ